MKGKNGTPGETRTPNPLIRSQMLYPIELPVRQGAELLSLGRVTSIPKRPEQQIIARAALDS